MDSSKFKELWKVNRLDEANDLLRVGWKFIQVIYDGKEVQSEGWISTKTVGAMQVPHYLLARTNGVPPRKNSYEGVHYYLKRLGKLKEDEV